MRVWSTFPLPMRLLLLLLSASLCLAHAPPARAQPAGGNSQMYENTGFTHGEMALLPPICRDIQGTANFSGPRGDYWRATIGADAIGAMHHYCRGLRNLQRLQQPGLNPMVRRNLWEGVADEMLFVLRHSASDMPMAPELWYRAGVAYLNLNNPTEAQRAFERARQLKPDYWPAYTGWVDYLIERNVFDQAQALIDEGLRHAPDSPELQQRRDRLKR